MGFIRPNILFYSEDNYNGVKIGKIVLKDLQKAPNILIIAGTSLKVPGAKRLVKDFCHATKAYGKTIVWINIEAAPSRLNTTFDFVVRATCEYAVMSMQAISRRFPLSKKY